MITIIESSTDHGKLLYRFISPHHFRIDKIGKRTILLKSRLNEVKITAHNKGLDEAGYWEVHHSKIIGVDGNETACKVVDWVSDGNVAFDVCLDPVIAV